MADTPTKILEDGTTVYLVAPGKYSRRPPGEAAPAQGQGQAEGAPPPPAGGPHKIDWSKHTQAAPSENNAAKLGQELGEGAADSAIAFGTGLTMGADDEIVGALGGDRDAYQARKNLGRERNPVASTLSEGVASTVGAGKIAQAVKGAGKLVRAATSPVAQDAISGAMSAEPGSRLEGALEGVVSGKIAGGVVEGAGKVASRVASGETARRLLKAADELRVKAGGQSIAEAADNPGGVAGQAEALRRLGIGKKLLTGRDTMRDEAGQAVQRLERARAPIKDRLAKEQISGQAVASRLHEAKKRLPAKGAEDDRRFLEGKAQLFEPKVQPRAAAAAPEPPLAPAGPMARTAPGGGRARRAPAPAPDTAPSPPPVMTPQPVSAASRNEMPGRGREIVDNPISFEELEKGRQYFGNKANFQSGSPEARRNQDVFHAHAEAQRELGNRVEPGLGDQYRQLGRDQMHAMNAESALSRGESGNRSYWPWAIAGRVAGSYAPNLKAHAAEGAAGVAEFLSPTGGNVNEAMLASGYEQAAQLGAGMGRLVAGQTTNDESPGLDSAIIHYQQSALDPAYRLRDRDGVE